MEETNSSQQCQPGELLAQGRLQPLEFPPGEEAALGVQEPVADRDPPAPCSKAGRACLLVPGNALPQAAGK